MEAVDPMATTEHGGNPRCLNVFGRAKGSRRSMQPFGTSSSRAGGPERPKPEAEAGSLHSRLGRLPPELGTEEAEARGLHSRSGHLPHELVTGRAQ